MILLVINKIILGKYVYVDTIVIFFFLLLCMMKLFYKETYIWNTKCSAFYYVISYCLLQGHQMTSRVYFQIRLYSLRYYTQLVAFDISIKLFHEKLFQTNRKRVDVCFMILMKISPCDIYMGQAQKAIDGCPKEIQSVV